MTARMPGRYARPWCRACQSPAGPDCCDVSTSPRQVRRRLQQALRRDPEHA